MIVRYRSLFASVIALPLLAAGCFSINSAPPDGGVFRSDNAGATWSQKVFVANVKDKVQTIGALSINLLVMDPNDHNTLYAASAGSGIYKTTDSGENWSVTGLANGGWSALAIDPTSSALLYAGSGGTIVKSADAGRTWSTVYVETRPNQAVQALAVDPNDPTRVLVGMNTGVILETRDYGNTWKILSVVTGPVQRIELFPSSAVAYVQAGSTLVRSTDRGITWTPIPITLPEGTAAVNGISIFPDAPQMLTAGTSLGFVRSRDGGTTWESIRTLTSAPSPLSVDRVAVDPVDRTHLYAVIGTRFHASLDDGKTWNVQVLPTGRRITAFLIRPDQPTTMFIGTYVVKK
jgi:photosystem II stability/assembly factor-like uncharacterized protein